MRIKKFTVEAGAQIPEGEERDILENHTERIIHTGKVREARGGVRVNVLEVWYYES